MFCCSPAASLAAGSAFKVESAEVSPDGDLQAGVPVEVIAVVDFPGSSGTTFPSSDMLSLYSELDNPRWQWSVEISGHENPKPDGNGKFFKISGFELEYPKESSVKLRLKLDGTAPDVKVSQNITVLRIQQLDRSSKVVENSEYTIIRRVVNPADRRHRARQSEVVSRALRIAIDQQTAQGANTTEAERKYAEADRLLKSAESGNISVQSGSLAKAVALIDAVQPEPRPVERPGGDRPGRRTDQERRRDADLLQGEQGARERPARRGDHGQARERRSAARPARATARRRATSTRPASGPTSPRPRRSRPTTTRSISGRSSRDANTSANASAAANTGGGGFLPYIIVIAVIAVIAIGVVLFQRRGRWDELG